MKQVWKPSELVAANLGDVRFFIEPLTTPGSTLVVFGPREAGKTQLFFTMVRAMHEEEALLGRFAAKSARVALVEVDMSVMTTQERLQKALSSYTFSDDLFKVATPPACDILGCSVDTPWVAELRAFEPQVVAFDSLRKIHRGDENSPSVPSLVYGKCQELFPGAALWFAHHVKKPPATWVAEKEKYNAGEDPNAYRGTTAWLDDADAALYLYKEPKNDRRTLKVVRARYAPDSVKHETHRIVMSADSMFLELAEGVERGWAAAWKTAHPDGPLEALVEALREQFPNRSRATYYNWAK